MGDAALGLAVADLADLPRSARVRNMSDPVINGDLPTDPFHLNPQTTWADGVSRRGATALADRVQCAARGPVDSAARPRPAGYESAG